ncbi:heavy metal translocating P-type ATPase [Alicyclobacillus sp. ALC3]|uniref:heavy metal translocating P-type ATPase n=1 Tax=Alicyclobacillus sp. ALC3 TaxID=2796143 RepID=UPI00237877A1|nr:cation-translocating P-type ATPase [Alicyclobacillus sp. ALC3]
MAKGSWNSIRFWFVAVIALVVLGEVTGETFGWLDRLIEVVPIWLLLVATALGGYPIFRRALLGIRSKQSNVDQMMSVGILAAILVGQFVSALLLVFFMSIAHYLEGYTVNQVRQAIRHLVELAPSTARVVRGEEEAELPVGQVKPGEIVRVRPGERIPVDGHVVEGKAVVNQATITGESLPVEKGRGDEVYAGTIAERGFLDVKMERSGEQTMLGQIIHLVEYAEAQKAPIQRFADKFTAWFLPSVLAIALLTYILSGHLMYAVAVLVAACPCAVGLATPLSVVSSVGSAARRGLLIKGGLTLETLARVDTFVVDKTGTLTLGEPQVTEVVPASDFFDEETIIQLASSLERFSEHPLAGAIRKVAFNREIPLIDAEDFAGLPGLGLRGRINGKQMFLGNRKWLTQNGVEISSERSIEAEEFESAGQTVLFLARENSCIGLIAVADPVRPNVAQALNQLRKMGIRKVVLLSGDNAHVVEAVANELGIDDVHAECLPTDKIRFVQSLQAEGHVVAVVGDGVNDAPSLVQADVGIAMGVVGSDIATEAADVVLMRDDWRQVVDAIEIGRRTARTIRQNIGIGIGWNVMTLGMASIGIIGPVLSAASEAMPDVFVALNSSRLYRKNPATKV